MQQRTSRSVVVILISLGILLLALPTASSLNVIVPADRDQLTNQQPMFSWTDYAGAGLQHYTLTIATEPDLDPATYVLTTTSPYHQIQTALPKGTWYWRATAIGTNASDETPISSFEIIDVMSYTITPDFSRYEVDKRVVFTIDAPLGTAVEARITADGFNLPFITPSLQSRSFTTFLDPGQYAISAEFVNQGMTRSFTSTFVVAATELQTVTITFNVTDEENLPLRGVEVSLEGEDEDYDLRTNGDGIATAAIIKGEYEVIVSKEGYVEERFDDSFDRDELYAVFLLSEEQEQATAALNLAAASSAQVSIAITAPASGERIIATAFDLNFTVTDHNKVSLCTALYKTAEQQGWTLVGTDTSVEERNTMAIKDPRPGDARMKVRCESTDGKYYESDVRSLNVVEVPENHPGVQAFLQSLDEAKGNVQSLQQPLFIHLNIGGRITAARKQIIDMEAQYLSALEAGDEQQASASSSMIDERIDTLKGTLIVGASIVKETSDVLAADEEAAREIIGSYVATLGLDDDMKEDAMAFHIEDQESYSARTKTVIAELVMLDGSKKYVTGVTRTLQPYAQGDDEGQRYTVLESLPSQFLQVAGTPTVLSSAGEELEALREGVVSVTLGANEAYTLLFSGDVGQSSETLHAFAVIKETNYGELAQRSSGALSGITGAVVSAWESIGLDTLSPWVFIVAFLIIITFALNPFTAIPERQQRKRVREITDVIHDTLDLLEQERYDEAFLAYPAIIESFEKLSPRRQEELSFAIASLSAELHVYLFSQSLEDARTRLAWMSSPEGVLDVRSSTEKLIEDYRRLDPEAKARVLPSLQRYQEELKVKHQYLASSREQAKRI